MFDSKQTNTATLVIYLKHIVVERCFTKTR